MSDTFDYGGEVAETAGGFKNPAVGTRNARLYGLIRVGTFRETYGKELKAPAPQGIAIFHLLGKEDKNDDESPMFFTKPFPFKKGDKSFLHKNFIPAFGGMAKHKGFGTMINQLCSLTLKGKDKNEDGTPKYINFESVANISEDTLELLDESPKFAPLEDPIGFLAEDQLTERALKALHPTREFAGIVMQTEEFKAGTHPSQELIQSIYDADKERYTIKAKDKEESKGQGEEQQSQNNKAEGGLPTEDLAGEEEQEF